MNPDPASLGNLRDIVPPDPVSWWPLAAGWWIVIVAIGLAIAFGLARGWRTWKANAYRRAALAELQQARSVADVATVLKRVALCAFPRSSVASLSGQRWCRWLESTSDARMTPEVSGALTRGLFADEDSEGVVACQAFAAKWIQSHETPNKTVGAGEAVELNFSGTRPDGASSEEKSEGIAC
ncbi:MAG: DUF4381 domain-containing protein [Rubripirellula sp.]